MGVSDIWVKWPFNVRVIFSFTTNIKKKEKKNHIWPHHFCLPCEQKVCVYVCVVEKKEEEGAFFFFLVYVIGLNDPRPRLDKTGELDTVWLQPKREGGRQRGREREEKKNKAVKQLDRHLLGVYARPYFNKQGRTVARLCVRLSLLSLSPCLSLFQKKKKKEKKKPRFLFIYLSFLVTHFGGLIIRWWWWWWEIKNYSPRSSHETFLPGWCCLRRRVPEETKSASQLAIWHHSPR